MISDHISVVYIYIYDDIPPQVNILNMVILILMHFCVNFTVKIFCFISNWRVVSVVIQPNVTKLIMSNISSCISQLHHRIYCRKFLVLSSQKLCLNSKFIRIKIDHLNLNFLLL